MVEDSSEPGPEAQTIVDRRGRAPRTQGHEAGRVEAENNPGLMAAEEHGSHSAQARGGKQPAWRTAAPTGARASHSSGRRADRVSQGSDTSNFAHERPATSKIDHGREDQAASPEFRQSRRQSLRDQRRSEVEELAEYQPISNRYEAIFDRLDTVRDFKKHREEVARRFIYRGLPEE